MAGHDVDGQVRPDEVELAALDRAARVERRPAHALPNRPELGREEAARLEHVGVDRDVDDLREAGMGDLAVVALEEVLAADLPVGRVLGVRALEEAERVELEPGRGDELRQLAERLGERRRLGIRVDEDERPPGVDRAGRRPSSAASKLGLAVGARRRAERAVELVRPGVVGALERLAPALALADERAAVAADVQERAQLGVLAADDDDRDPARVAGEERTRLGDLVGAAGVLPGSPEDPLALEPQDGRVGVPVEGDRAAAAVAMRNLDGRPVASLHEAVERVGDQADGDRSRAGSRRRAAARPRAARRRARAPPSSRTPRPP